MKLSPTQKDSEIINKDLQQGFENYKKAYEMINQQYEELLSEAMKLKNRADKDRGLLKLLMKSLEDDIENYPDDVADQTHEAYKEAKLYLEHKHEQ